MQHLIIAAFLWGAAAGVAHAQTGSQPPGWDASIKLTQAIDKSPDPRVLEIDLDARIAKVEFAPGETIEAWTYGGGLPGPLIHARVGDRLIVHFTNHLPQPTTVHWHGVRVPIEMDGVPEHSQPEVPPGGGFVYDFVLRDAGLFWYHPHVMSAAQTGFGLYGALLVDDPSDGIGVADELVMVLSDIGIASPGVFEPADSGGSAGMVFGREGGRLLVNGRERPAFEARSGAPQRWRIVNAAKSRYFELDMGRGFPFTTIGVDGGLLEYAVTSETLVLAPGERRDVIVAPRGDPGSKIVVQAVLYNRGYGSVETRMPFDDLFTVAIADLPPVVTPPLPAVHRVIEPLPSADATRVQVDLTLAVLRDRSFAYGIDGVPFQKDKPFHARLGETQIWTVTNKTKWSHPFHLHGFFFQVLDDRGQPVRPLAWRDTVDVPLEQTVRLIVKFDERPGSWMFHCHILDHADGGLMGMVEVGDVEHRHHLPSTARGRSAQAAWSARRFRYSHDVER